MVLVVEIKSLPTEYWLKLTLNMKYVAKMTTLWSPHNEDSGCFADKHKFDLVRTALTLKGS